MHVCFYSQSSGTRYWAVTDIDSAYHAINNLMLVFNMDAFITQKNGKRRGDIYLPVCSHAHTAKYS